MLGTCQQLHILMSGVALQAAHHTHAHAPIHIRILAIALLTTTPTRIAEHIDRRGPEAKTFIFADLTTAPSVGILRTGLIADGGKHLLDHIIVKRCRHADARREHGSQTVAAHSVQSLAPPVKCGDTEAFYSRRTVHHQLGFLLKGKSRTQVGGTGLRALRRIEIHSTLTARGKRHTCACQEK